MHDSPAYRRHPASFKDPAGFIFTSDGKYYRQVNSSYAEEYDRMMSSGLYEKLVEKKLLVPHAEIKENFTASPDWYLTLLPQQLPFISYPYEWTFDELKDAALATLRVQKIALIHDMSLKDATPFNIQFYEGRPVFIDTLSFERHDETRPWIAYRQFCQCFLFPLVIEHYRQIDAQKLLSVYLEGIPAKTTAALLPFKSRFNLSIWLHVWLQHTLKVQEPGKGRDIHFSKEKLVRLLESLQSAIRPLRIDPRAASTWNHYYDQTILSKEYLAQKESIFRSMTRDLRDTRALDLGCNDGYFTKILTEQNTQVIAVDADSQCVNRLYLEVKSGKAKGILPLCIDLTNPSAANGLNHTERQSFANRAPSELVIALALVHHLVLSKNVPLHEVAVMLAGLTQQHLIIEFVPLEDEKSQQLIRDRTSYHRPYDQAAFENHFSEHFKIEQKEMIGGTGRILYRMKKRPTAI